MYKEHVEFLKGIDLHNIITLLIFTFLQQDFGDYLESYYSVQTNEGEKISQLIAGYIDIILKKVKQYYLYQQIKQCYLSRY